MPTWNDGQLLLSTKIVLNLLTAFHVKIYYPWATRITLIGKRFQLASQAQFVVDIDKKRKVERQRRTEKWRGIASKYNCDSDNYVRLFAECNAANLWFWTKKIAKKYWQFTSWLIFFLVSREVKSCRKTTYFRCSVYEVLVCKLSLIDIPTVGVWLSKNSVLV